MTPRPAQAPQQKRPTARRPTGKREQNKEKTKERILHVALELFRHKGVEGTTTKEISKQAGIAEGTLFNAKNLVQNSFHRNSCFFPERNRECATCCTF